MSSYSSYRIRRTLVQAMIAHAEAKIKFHASNVEVLLENPTGVGEHGSIAETIEEELNKVAHYEDQLAVIKKHFNDY